MLVGLAAARAVGITKGSVKAAAAAPVTVAFTEYGHPSPLTAPVNVVTSNRMAEPPRRAVFPFPNTSQAKPTRGLKFFRDGLINNCPGLSACKHRGSAHVGSLSVIRFRTALPRPFISVGSV